MEVDGVGGMVVTYVPECAFKLSKLLLYRCLPDCVTNSLLEIAASLGSLGLARHFILMGVEIPTDK